MSGGDDFDGPPPPKRKVTGATDHSGKLSQSSRARQRRLAELMGAAYETLAQSSTDLTGMVPREKVRLERPQGRRYEMSQEQVEAYQESQLKNAADIKKLLEMLSKQYQKAEEQEAHDMEDDDEEDDEHKAEVDNLRQQIEVQTATISELQQQMLSITSGLQDGSFLYDPDPNQNGDDSDEDRRERVERRMEALEKKLTELTKTLMDLETELKAAEIYSSDDDDDPGFGL